MPTDDQTSTDDSSPVIIVIRDPSSGTETEYRVHPSIASAIKRLLEGPPDSEPGAVSWDSACRV